MLDPKNSVDCHSASLPETLARSILADRRRFSQKSYLKFLSDGIRHSFIYKIARTILNIVRRWNLLRAVVTVAVAIITALETSAIFILISALYLTALPFLILGGGIAFFLTVIRARKQNARIVRYLRKKQIFVFIPSDAKAFNERSFFEQNVRYIASRGNTAVIVVSPFVWSCKGFGEHTPYFTARVSASENIILVRKNYYFMLRRNILSSHENKLILVY